eukprot:6207881-Pleurochrysis_carterae.AAC.1
MDYDYGVWKLMEPYGHLIQALSSSTLFAYPGWGHQRGRKVALLMADGLGVTPLPSTANQKKLST